MQCFSSMLSPKEEEELQNIYSNKTPKRQRNQLPLFLVKMIAKLEGHKVMHTKTETNIEPPQTMGGT